MSFSMVPFTEDQVASLNAFQVSGYMHPFTCGNECRPGVLIAQTDGWHCSTCGYRQDWAHDFTADWSWAEAAARVAPWVKIPERECKPDAKPNRGVGITKVLRPGIRAAATLQEQLSVSGVTEERLRQTIIWQEGMIARQRKDIAKLNALRKACLGCRLQSRWFRLKQRFSPSRPPGGAQ